MEVFDKFPDDIKAYILKENPRFRQINKYYATHTYLFEEKYCNDPISKHEFFSYINSNLKPDFTIYAINDDSCKIWQFVYSRRDYKVYKLHIKKLNNEKLHLDGGYNYADKTYLHDINNFYRDYKYIHYDIITVNNIIKARKCSIPNHNITYSVNYLDKMLSYMKDEQNLDNFYDMTILNVYFGENDIITNFTIGVYEIDFSKLSEQNMINLYNDIIKTYKTNINVGYERQVDELI